MVCGAPAEEGDSPERSLGAHFDYANETPQGQALTRRRLLGGRTRGPRRRRAEGPASELGACLGPFWSCLASCSTGGESWVSGRVWPGLPLGRGACWAEGPVCRPWAGGLRAMTARPSAAAPPPTVCTAWLKMSFSAVTLWMRSRSRCLSRRKRCSRRLRPWHDSTLALYSSFSFRTTAGAAVSSTVPAGPSCPPTPCRFSPGRGLLQATSSPLHASDSPRGHLSLPEFTASRLDCSRVRGAHSPCFTVDDRQSLPARIWSMAVCRPEDSSSATFR